MTDTERQSPTDTPIASAIEDADLDQVVGGDKATTTTTHDFNFTHPVDKASPNLFFG
jgi:type VI protein secretion system component Hcp